jgi:hypothetical protein
VDAAGYGRSDKGVQFYVKFLVVHFRPVVLLLFTHALTFLLPTPCVKGSFMKIFIDGYL